jgi:hypothetical protein
VHGSTNGYAWPVIRKETPRHRGSPLFSLEQCVARWRINLNFVLGLDLAIGTHRRFALRCEGVLERWAK